MLINIADRRERQVRIEIKANREIYKKFEKLETRPDTRQDRRGRLGRSGNAKTTRDSKMLQRDGPTDQPTRHGVESRVRD